MHNFNHFFFLIFLEKYSNIPGAMFHLLLLFGELYIFSVSHDIYKIDIYKDYSFEANLEFNNIINNNNLSKIITCKKKKKTFELHNFNNKTCKSIY